MKRAGGWVSGAVMASTFMTGTALGENRIQQTKVSEYWYVTCVSHDMKRQNFVKGECGATTGVRGVTNGEVVKMGFWRNADNPVGTLSATIQFANHMPQHPPEWLTVITQYPEGLKSGNLSVTSCAGKVCEAQWNLTPADEEEIKTVKGITVEVQKTDTEGYRLLLPMTGFTEALRGMDEMVK